MIIVGCKYYAYLEGYLHFFSDSSCLNENENEKILKTFVLNMSRQNRSESSNPESFIFTSTFQVNKKP